MLLIGDIHITSKIQAPLLENLRSFVAAHPSEQTIVFMGDFVYHFSYDRNALLRLFEFFLELYREGKMVYILAGNHDWLGNSFVYEEGKQVFDLLQSAQDAGKLLFITQPWCTELEGERVLFLPYCLDFDEKKYPEWALGSTLLTEALAQSQDKNEQFSAKLNQLVYGFLKTSQSLTIIHHYYTNKVQFPGYRSSFSFKDVALSEQLLEEANLKLISGHLHAPFVHKNYLCTGSIWATSPLESNQIKGVRRYVQGQLSFFSMQVINYFQLEQKEVVQEQDIMQSYQECADLLEKNLKNQSFFPLNTFYIEPLDLKKVVLNIKVDALDYEKIDEVLAPELREKIADFRLKKSTQKVDDLLQKLEKPDGDALQTFGGWKELLKSYLQTQYGEEYPRYEAVLRELKVL